MGDSNFNDRGDLKAVSGSLPHPPARDDYATARLTAWFNIGAGILLLGPLVVFGPQLTDDRIAILMLSGMACYGVLLTASGILIMRTRCWLCSVVLAAITAALPPMGTIIGGYTLYVLCSKNVRLIYEEKTRRARDRV